MAGEPRTVLLVDDSEDDRALVRRLLTRQASRPFAVLEEERGEPALARLQTEPPDCVLLDYRLPDMDGFEFLARCRDAAGDPIAPIVVLTGWGDERLAVQALQRGALDYLPKDNLTSAALEQALERAIEAAALRRQFEAQRQALAASEARFRRAVTEQRRLLVREQAARTRVERLQSITAALSGAVTPEQVAHAVLQQGLDGLGASAGVLALLSDDGHWLQIVGVAGHPPRTLDAYRRWPADAPLPIAVAVRRGSLVYLTSREQMAADFPLLAETDTVGRAWSAVPLMVEARAIGGLTLSYPQARVFDADEQAFLLTLGQLCAQALERARLYASAEAAVRHRDELLATISHDLKHPLTLIYGTSQLLLRRLARQRMPADDWLVNRLNTVRASAEQMNVLIDELVDDTRRRLGRLVALPAQPVDLVRLARQVAQEHQLRTQQHRLVVEPVRPTLYGTWDEAPLRRVLDNLLDNAVKYSAGGTVSVRVAAEPVPGTGRSWAVLAVRDEGIGIPVADLPHVFEPFRRGANVPTQVAGTGIGLAGVQQIVEQFGGRVEVDSAEGQGSTFTVRLPLEAEQSSER